MIEWICWKLKIGWVNSLIYVDENYKSTYRWFNVKTGEVRHEIKD